MAPVGDPGVSVGQDARSALARNRAALSKANGVIVQSRDWYAGVVRSYAGVK